MPRENYSVSVFYYPDSGSPIAEFRIYRHVPRTEMDTEDLPKKPKDRYTSACCRKPDLRSQLHDFNQLPALCRFSRNGELMFAAHFKNDLPVDNTCGFHTAEFFPNGTLITAKNARDELTRFTTHPQQLYLGGKPKDLLTDCAFMLEALQTPVIERVNMGNLYQFDRLTSF